MSKKILKNKSTILIFAYKMAFFSFALLVIAMTILFNLLNDYVDNQIAISLKQKVAAFQGIYKNKGISGVKNKINLEIIARENSGFYILLYDGNNNKIAGNVISWPPSVSTVPSKVVKNEWVEDEYVPLSEEDEDYFWPMIVTELGDGNRLLLAQDVERAEDFQEYTQISMVSILIISVGVILTFGIFLASKINYRVNNINLVARKIIDGELSTRIPISSKHDEFDELSDHLNKMLDKVEQLLSGMRNMTDNVAHDLRSPLNRIMTKFEVSLLEKRDVDYYKKIITSAVSEITELLKTFNVLLEISQAESSSFRGNWTIFNLSDVVQNIADLYEAFPESQSRKFHTNITDNINLKGNPHLLSQVIANLLDNAFKYSSKYDEISLRLLAGEDNIIIEIADTGPGILDVLKEEVFRKFRRLDSARKTEGNGLGLTLVKAIVELHKGKIALLNNNPGLLARVILPKPNFID